MRDNSLVETIKFEWMWLNMQTQTIKNDWQQRGFSFGIWEDLPGQIWRDFVHDEDELFMVLEGEVNLTVNGKEIIPQIGEEIFIPAGAVHTVKTSSASSSRWCYGYRK
jgi:cupin 2 domain-containing protein